jgi:cell division protein FtsA
MAGQSQFRVIGAATTRSRGVRFGEIAVMNETERAIRTAVQAAQKMANVRVDHVIACFSGAEPRSYGLAGELDLQDSVVTEQDVSRVLAACDVPDLGQGREVLHAQPVNFALDHRSGLGDPRGQIGHRLACDMHLLSVDGDVVQNLLYCIKRCDLELAGIASSAYVSAISSLVEDEQELGAACIDMGGGATGMSIFMKKHMIYADSVRMGGDHVTSDISKGLQIPMATAERIKTRHGGLYRHRHGRPRDDRHRRRQRRLGKGPPPDQPDRADRHHAAPGRGDPGRGARHAGRGGLRHLPSQQIVLTGGAARSPALTGWRRASWASACGWAGPLRVQGLPQAATGAAFAVGRGAVPVRGASAGRMVGLRNSGRTLSGPVAAAGGQMVQGQLVNTTSGSKGEIPLNTGVCPPDFVVRRMFFA